MVEMDKVNENSRAPVYEAKVTMHGSRTLVPMTVVWTNDWGKGYVVGYVMPSGHCKRYNVDENWPCRSVEAAAGLLEELAAKRKWKPWPEDRPVECIDAKKH